MRPTWGQVREFCCKQGYRETRTDHFRYVRALADRTTSGTMVSFGVDGEELSAQRWRLVWRHQLRLASEGDFWRGLRGESVEYAISTGANEPVRLPEYLQRFLAGVLHYSEAQIAGITRDAAQHLLNEYYARELREADT